MRRNEQMQIHGSIAVRRNLQAPHPPLPGTGQRAPVYFLIAQIVDTF